MIQKLATDTNETRKIEIQVNHTNILIFINSINECYLVYKCYNYHK